MAENTEGRTEKLDAPNAKAQSAGLVKTDPSTGVWKMDADAFLPEPAGNLMLAGVEYPIFSFLDIPVETSIRVVKLDEDIRASSSYQEHMERSVEQILMLNRGPCDVEGKPITHGPQLSEGQLRKLAPRQLVVLTLMATSIARIPQKADEVVSAVENASASPAPASADSTGGPLPS